VSVTGPKIASGRAADLFDHGPGKVLRRYRWDIDSEREAAVMRHARAHGYPAPEVFSAAGRDMVLERIEGPTMLAAMTRAPWRIGPLARLLADLQARLHQIGFEGGALLHLDLHPDNVLLAPGGPVVIDWANARGGDPAVDVATTWVILETSVVPGPAPVRALARFGRGRFLDAYLASVDRAAAGARVPEVARTRLADNPRLRPEERPALERPAR
jgi:aminoglycoside phosphotransferase (APT) family kinase protein